MTRGTALHGRLKVAAAFAVEACGSVEGAGATAGRGKSTAGRWHNAADPDLPPIDAALLMDKVAVAKGETPPIASAFATELGKVLIDLPDADTTRDCWHRIMASLADGHSDLLSGLLRDIADHRIEPREARARRRDAQALLAVVVEADQRLRAIEEGEI